MVDPSDSLAGNRIEGLPNVTESRWIFFNDFILFPMERDVRKKSVLMLICKKLIRYSLF